MDLATVVDSANDRTPICQAKRRPGQQEANEANYAGALNEVFDKCLIFP
jgi:hypothetical protein